MTEKPERWLLEMTEPQVREVYAALELVARIRMGQLDDLRRLLTRGDSSYNHKVLDALFTVVRTVAFPELSKGESLGAAYDMATTRLWDMYIAMRNTVARRKAELSEDDDLMSRFLVTRDDPAHRMMSDWPMIKMVPIDPEKDDAPE